MKSTILVFALLLPVAASAQVMLGRATAIDGDTIAVGDERIRLHGIDAVERTQTCRRAGETWPCGSDATDLLAYLLLDSRLECRQMDIDQYGRSVAVCRASGKDLGEELIKAGLAVALPTFSDAYVATEAEARASQIGIWGSEFQLPADFRSANPQPQQARPTAQSPNSYRAVTGKASRPSNVYYRNCAAALAAGAAPIYRGQPGYRSEMDGDNDGIACEPFRPRR